MGLAFGQFQSKRQAGSIDKRMDLCRQAAPRAAHATGSSFFGVGGMPMHADRGRVDHLDIAIVSL
jgi:hypothetical protein